MNVNFYKKIFKRSKNIDSEIYKDFFTKQLILRDYLAIERTILTNENTYLGYIRTSLTILVVGITLFHLSPDNIKFQYAGLLLTFLGIAMFLIGSIKSIKMKNKINKFLEKRDEVIEDIGITI